MVKGLIAIDLAPPRREPGWVPEVPALAPVANRPLLLRAYDALRAAGIADILVVGDAAALAAVGPLLDAEAPGVECLRLDRPGGPGEALLAAAGWLEGDDVVVHAGDGMLLRGAHGLMRAVSDAGQAEAIVFFGSAPHGEPVDAERVTGVHVLSRAILPALEATTPRADGRRSLLDAVDRLAATGGRVRAGVLESWWTWDGTSDGLLEVNHEVLDALPARPRHADHEDARIEGRVSIDPTAYVRGAVIRGPVVIGAHAIVTDAYVGPFTAIGQGAVIDNAEIESSIVLPGAKIRHVGVRLEDSIVGDGATVGRDFAVPKAMRLRIGRDASITLA